jgi:hypothetical protein
MNMDQIQTQEKEVEPVTETINDPNESNNFKNGNIDSSNTQNIMEDNTKVSQASSKSNFQMFIIIGSKASEKMSKIKQLLKQNMGSVYSKSNL